MIGTFAALAHPERLGIVELLRAGPKTVNDIGERLDLPQPQVSKHLRTLREAGLVEARPQAQQRVYRLRGQALRELQGWLARYQQLWEARLDELDGLVGELKEKDAVRPTDRRRRR